MKPLFTGPEFALYVCVAIFVACCIGIAIKAARAWSRLPSRPPLYDYSDDVLDEPTVRCRRYQPHPEAEWIIE